MKVLVNGENKEMEYNEICEDLGFIPGIHFVKVTNRGTISFTAGKPNEVKALYRSVVDHGYKPAKNLVEAI